MLRSPLAVLESTVRGPILNLPRSPLPCISWLPSGPRCSPGRTHEVEGTHTGSDGHCDPPCIPLGGLNVVLDLRACGLGSGAQREKRGAPCSLHMQGAESTGLAVLATDHLLYFYDSYYHGIENLGSSGLKTEAGGGGSVPFLTPDHQELRSSGNKEHGAGCLPDPVARQGATYGGSRLVSSKQADMGCAAVHMHAQVLPRT